MNAPIVVLPVCRPDFNLACKWLKWARALSLKAGGPQKYGLIVFAAKSVEERLLQKLRDLTDGWAHVEVNPEYYERHDLGYAACANHGFRSGLEMTERLFRGYPTLWIEPDCIPIHPKWFSDIADEYAWCGKPFMGDFHAPSPIPHMTGNGIYPPNWRTLAPSLAALPEPRPFQGWDTLCAHETVPQSHKSSRIQQTWIVPMPRFTEQNVNMVHPGTALFHRCKDGSLIDVLAARMGIDPIPLDPPICAPAPMYASVGAAMEHAQPTPPARSGVHGLIVSCKRDAEMLSYLLRSIEKHAKGFAGFTLMVPVADVHAFKNIPSCVKITTFDEMRGKGFLHHMIQKCRADEICPDADYVVHIDSDVIFWEDFTPEDFVKNGKCLMVRERYDVIGKRNPNRLIWQLAVERAVGFKPEWEGMTRHCNVYPRALYSHVRSLVEQRHRMDFNSYVFSCENGFPQNFAEFPTLAACGIRDMPEAFNFVEYDHDRDRVECGLSPTLEFQYVYRRGRDRVAEGWSHGGLARHKLTWDQIESGQPPEFYVK